jgi:1-acyl-sn-glycerol-3-phosphate acyltransferase
MTIYHQEGTMYRFAKTILVFLLKIFRIQYQVVYRERIPKSGPFVAVCTHRTWLDILFLALALYPQPIHFMAKQELFQNKFIGKLLTSLHAFPVNRNNPGPGVMKNSIKRLKDGHIVGIFPSGTRTMENNSLKKGAAWIANKANVPILPAVYHGPLSWRQLVREKKITILICEPIDLKQYDEQKDIVQYATQKINDSFIILENEWNRSSH